MEYLCLDVLIKIIHLADFKSIIRMGQTNKMINNLLVSDIIYQELSLLRKCKNKYKFDSIDIHKQYAKLNMINVISEYKCDHPYLFRIAVNKGHIDLIKLIHQSNYPYFKWSKFVLHNLFIESIHFNKIQDSPHILKFLYELNPSNFIDAIKSFHYSSNLNIYKWIFSNIPNSGQIIDIYNLLECIIKEYDADFLEWALNNLPDYFQIYGNHNNPFLLFYKKIPEMDSEKLNKFFDLLFQRVAKFYPIYICWDRISKHNHIFVMDKWLSSGLILTDWDIYSIINGALYGGHIDVLVWLDKRIPGYDYSKYKIRKHVIYPQSLPVLEWIKQNKETILKYGKRLRYMVNENVGLYEEDHSYYRYKIKYFEKYFGDTIPLIKWQIENQIENEPLIVDIGNIETAIIFHGTKIIPWLRKNNLLNPILARRLLYLITHIKLKINITEMDIISEFNYEIDSELIFYSVKNGRTDFLNYLRQSKNNFFNFLWSAKKIIQTMDEFNILDLIINGKHEEIVELKNFGIKMMIKTDQTDLLHISEIKKIFEWHNRYNKKFNYVNINDFINSCKYTLENIISQEYIHSLELFYLLRDKFDCKFIYSELSYVVLARRFDLIDLILKNNRIELGLPHNKEIVWMLDLYIKFSKEFDKI